MTEVPQNLHRDIMRSVKIVKRRYYIFGLLTGFFTGLIMMLWVVYDKMVESGSFDFFGVLVDTLRIDMSLITDFSEDIKEFIPLQHLGWSLILFIIVSFLIIAIVRYRKILFLKVVKFHK